MGVGKRSKEGGSVFAPQGKANLGGGEGQEVYGVVHKGGRKEMDVSMVGDEGGAEAIASK